MGLISSMTIKGTLITADIGMANTENDKIKFKSIFTNEHCSKGSLQFF